MKTKIIILKQNDIDEEIIEEAAQCIKNGEVVAFPTETVYGLGADALNSKAVNKIFEAKGRPQDNPLIIHVADFNIEKYVKEVPEKARKLMEKYWPGPLTLILNKSDMIPENTSAKLSTVGVRMPDNPIALELIKKSGTTIAAPSANISGRPSPTEVEHCIEDLDGKIPYILGGGSCNVGVESTIVDCTSNTLCVLRPGGITLEMLKEVDENVYIDPQILKKVEGDFKPKAPGMKYRHYAPKAPVKIIKGNLKKTIEKINSLVQNYIDDNKLVGIIATEETKEQYNINAVVISMGSRNSIEDIAHNLFKVLRDFDELNIDVILSEAIEEQGIGIAIMNRLKKSAGFNIEEV